MPMGNDPTPEGELERAFGVTSNAEELVKANRARYSDQLRAALAKPENHELTAQFRPEPGDREAVEEGEKAIAKLADAVDENVQTAAVHGAGANATITYTYLDERGAIEKGAVPYAEVFGSAADKKAAREAAADKDPDAAAREAAAKTLSDADAKAAEKLREAEEKARKIVEEAQRKAEEERQKAVQEAEKERQKAAEQAPKDAEKAKQQAARSKS